MNTALLELLSDYLIITGLSATRVAVMFIMLPLFTAETMPALVRNALFIAIATVCVFIQPTLPDQTMSTIFWVNVFAKEVFVGVILGVFFGIYLWAFEAAGVVIDTQIGSSFAMIFDPIAGNEVTLFGELLGRWAVWLFVAAGGLMFLVGAVIESFSIWPLLRPVDGLRAASVRLFEEELSRFMSMTLMIAGPVLVVTFIVDIAMGLINRYAQQFNVFFLSTTIKSMASLALVAVLLPVLATELLSHIDIQSREISAYFDRIFADPDERSD